MIMRWITSTTKKFSSWLALYSEADQRHRAAIEVERLVYIEGRTAAQVWDIETVNPYARGTLKHGAWQAGYEDEGQVNRHW